MSTYLTAKQVEAKLQETRKEREFTGKVEKEAVKVIVETAKRNGNFGDKTLVCIDPVYVHIPVWQRKLYVPAATTIGENYDRHKWEVPKVLYLPSGKLICVDGMHRLYGAFLGRIETVTVELITDLTEKEAIQLFLDQTARRPMSPADTYKAGVKAGRADCLRKCETGIKAIKNGNSDDTTELVGQIMDQVENFMEEREGTEEPILVGDNYDKLSRSVTETLQNWGLLPKEGVQV